MHVRVRLAFLPSEERCMGVPSLLMNTIDTELFILEVRCRPVIWDSTLSGYSYKNEKRKAWQDLCKIFLKDFDGRTEAERCKLETELQKKWKNLRDCYTRELNKQKNSDPTEFRKKYIFFDMLSFLYPVCVNRPLPSSEDLEGTEEALSPELQEKAQTNPSKRTKPAEDLDKYFLLSLLTDFKNVPQNYKMDCKLEIMNVLRKYNTGCQNYSTSQTEYSSASYPAHYSSHCVSSSGLSHADIITDLWE